MIFSFLLAQDPSPALCCGLRASGAFGPLLVCTLSEIINYRFTILHCECISFCCSRSQLCFFLFLFYYVSFFSFSVSPAALKGILLFFVAMLCARELYLHCAIACCVLILRSSSLLLHCSRPPSLLSYLAPSTAAAKEPHRPSNHIRTLPAGALARQYC